jgi:arylsulfatase A-like enzyme
MTTVYGHEASRFIEGQSGKPWLLYLAFNAPHTPLQSTDELKQRVQAIPDEARRDLAALIVGLDDAIGNVMATLDKLKERENTLVFFFSDNGGPITVSKCNNHPLRAGKGSLYEGGMKIPFLVSWPAKLPQNQTYAEPVISLDVFPTALAAAKSSAEGYSKLEGTNLIPYLTGEKKPAEPRQLFWRTSGGENWAVREGDWKAVSLDQGPVELFNLSSDIGERKNLANENPEVVVRLKSAYERWNQANIAPAFDGPNNRRNKK